MQFVIIPTLHTHPLYKYTDNVPSLKLGHSAHQDFNIYKIPQELIEYKDGYVLPC